MGIMEKSTTVTVSSNWLHLKSKLKTTLKKKKQIKIRDSISAETLPTTPEALNTNNDKIERPKKM